MSAVIEVNDLRKRFRTPLRRNEVEILRGLSFSVEQGEVYGFLGPNGAGKTTTIRILMGLVAASGGSAKLLGEPVPSREARAKLGFLPESPYFYDYLTVAELLDLTGRLFGIEHRARKRRAEALIERVGLTRARKTPLKKYSKGMLQRAGLAQALINDPALVVLDEPTSGLDPVGRKDVRDIILSLREQGKTVFFSSHILADVETVSDRIGIVVGGLMRDTGSVRALCGDALLRTEVVVRVPAALSDADQAALVGDAGSVERRPVLGADGPSEALHELHLSLAPDADVDAFLAHARQHGARVESVSPRRRTLEDLFLHHAGVKAGAGAGPGAGPAGEPVAESQPSDDGTKNTAEDEGKDKEAEA